MIVSVAVVRSVTVIMSVIVRLLNRLQGHDRFLRLLSIVIDPRLCE